MQLGMSICDSLHARIRLLIGHTICCFCQHATWPVLSLSVCLKNTGLISCHGCGYCRTQWGQICAVKCQFNVNKLIDWICSFFLLHFWLLERYIDRYIFIKDNLRKRNCHRGDVQKIVHSSAVESIDSITVLFSTLGNVSTRYPIGAVSGKLTEDSALNGTASRALGSWESSCVDSLFAVSSWSRLITANRHSVCAAWPACWLGRWTASVAVTWWWLIISIQSVRTCLTRQLPVLNLRTGRGWQQLAWQSVNK